MAKIIIIYDSLEPGLQVVVPPGCRVATMPLADDVEAEEAAEVARKLGELLLEQMR